MEFIKQSVKENKNGMAVEAPTYPQLPSKGSMQVDWVPVTAALTAAFETPSAMIGKKGKELH